MKRLLILLLPFAPVHADWRDDAVTHIDELVINGLDKENSTSFLEDIEKYIDVKRESVDDTTHMIEMIGATGCIGELEATLEQPTGIRESTATIDADIYEQLLSYTEQWKKNVDENLIGLVKACVQDSDSFSLGHGFFLIYGAAARIGLSAINGGIDKDCFSYAQCDEWLNNSVAVKAFKHDRFVENLKTENMDTLTLAAEAYSVVGAYLQQNLNIDTSQSTVLRLLKHVRAVNNIDEPDFGAAEEIALAIFIEPDSPSHPLSAQSLKVIAESHCNHC